MGLMDNVKKGIAKAKEEAQELAQVTKLKAEITRLNGQRRDLFREIGEEVYSLYQRSEPIPGFETKCDALAAISEEVARKEKDIEELRAQ
ncbi:MAG: hypothetical protein R3E10_13590 [Gemmatimonadota bacterium]